MQFSFSNIDLPLLSSVASDDLSLNQLQGLQTPWGHYANYYGKADSSDKACVKMYDTTLCCNQINTSVTKLLHIS